MKDLIEALTILLKYGNPAYPTHCEHDILYIMDIDPSDVSIEDTRKLEELGILITDEMGVDQFCSYKFGSA